MGGLIGTIGQGLQDGTFTGGHGGLFGRLLQGATRAPQRESFAGARANGFGIPVGDLTKRPGEAEQRRGLIAQGQRAGDFAGTGEQGYNALTPEFAAERERLRRIANGEESVSALQLKQALDSNIAQQRSMAAGAAPRDAAMASMLAMRNAANATGGLAGQQAIAGIQERQAAAEALRQMLLQQRAQEMNVALGSRQNAISGFGGITPGQSWLEKYGGAVQAVALLAGLG